VINAIKFAIEEIEASDQYFDHTGSCSDSGTAATPADGVFGSDSCYASKTLWTWRVRAWAHALNGRFRGIAVIGGFWRGMRRVAPKDNCFFGD
jgi:hypothetical protein